MNTEENVEEMLNNLEIELDAEALSDMEELTKLQQNMNSRSSLGSDVFNLLQKAALDAASQIIDLSDVADGRVSQGGVIITPLNFEKQVFACDEDKVRYDEFQNRRNHSSDRFRRTKEYQERCAQIDEAIHTEGGATDCYTGKKLWGTPSEGKWDHEHIIPCNQYKEDVKAATYLNEEKLNKLVNSKKNVQPTSMSINRSKNDKDPREWLNEKDKNGNFVVGKRGEDRELVEKNINIAEKERKYTIVKEAVKGQAQNAAIGVGKSTLFYTGKLLVGETLKISIVEFIAEFKNHVASAGETLVMRFKRVFTNIAINVKNNLFTIWQKIKDAVKGNVISEIINTIMNFFFTTAKRLFKLIRSMIGSIIKAFKVIFSKKASLEERLFEALKIISVGLATSLGYMLDELIEKAIVTGLPFLTPIASTISSIVSALIASIASALICMAFDRYKGKMKFKEQQSVYNNLLAKGVTRSIGLAQISHYRTSIEIFQTYQMFEKGVANMSIRCNDIEQNFSKMLLIDAQIEEERKISHQLHEDRRTLLSDLNDL